MAGSGRQLELPSDPNIQRREWQFQRAGWLLSGFLLLAALAGLLGPGPLSQAEVHAADGSVTLEFDKYIRKFRPTELQLHLLAASEEYFQVKISRQFLQHIRIERIEPEPASQVLQSDGIVYSFLHDNSMQRVTIVFHIEYQSFGREEGRIGIVGKPPLTIAPLVFP